MPSFRLSISHFPLSLAARLASLTFLLSFAALPLVAQEDPAPAPAADGDPKEKPEEEKPSQFHKNDSASGLQMGVVNETDAGSLPEEVLALGAKGAMASADGKWEEAAKAYRAMVKKVPDNALALANLGIVEYRLKDYQSAQQHLEKSVAIKPNVAQNWLTLGLVYFYTEQMDLSLSALARALHEDPSDPRTHLYMAVVIRQRGWVVGAETELKRAITLDPSYADAHFNLTLMYLERNPPLIELARRHYFAALDAGAKADPEVEQMLSATVPKPSEDQ